MERVSFWWQLYVLSGKCCCSISNYCSSSTEQVYFCVSKKHFSRLPTAHTISTLHHLNYTPFLPLSHEGQIAKETFSRLLGSLLTFDRRRKGLFGEAINIFMTWRTTNDTSYGGKCGGCLRRHNENGCRGNTRIKNALYLNISNAYSALVSMNGFHV